MILLYVPERRAEKSVITLSDVPGQWRVASETLSGGVLQSQTFLLEAASYDALADAPIEASKFEEFTLPDVSPPVRVVIHGDSWKKHDVESALRKIVTYEVKMMDGAPYDHYTFIFHTGKAANAPAVAWSTPIAPRSTHRPRRTCKRRAHEFFHAWNVKRIRPPP